VDKLDVSDAIDKDASLAIPVLTAYLAAHPDLKAIGTQHGNITAILPKVLEAAGKKPATSSSAASIFRPRRLTVSKRLDQRQLRSGALPPGILPCRTGILDQELLDSGTAH